MKILITENQYSLYIRRRYKCVEHYIDELKAGKEKLRIPPGSFNWDVYQYLIVASIRSICSSNVGEGELYDENLHNQIMDTFGDDLYQIYQNNK